MERIDLAMIPHTLLPLPFQSRRPTHGWSALRVVMAFGAMLAAVAPPARAQTAHLGAQSTVVTGLSSPFGVAADAAGNLYVADTSNNQVLKEAFSAGSYTASTVATGLNLPYGVAVDVSGNVYIADLQNQRVLKETLSAGSYTQSTIADGTTPVSGSPTAGVNYPNAVAVDGSGNVYIADSSNNRVLKGTLSSGIYTYTVVDAGLNQPKGVVVDASGVVYVADTLNQRVVKETPSGSAYVQSLAATSTAASSGSFPYDYPFGIALDTRGNLYYSSYDTTTSTSQILRTVPSSGSSASSVVWTGADQPFGLATDASGNVYFADASPGTIVEVRVSGTSFPSTPVGTASATQTVTFTYDSGGALGGYAVLTQGAAGLDFSDAGGGSCATVVPATGATCTVNVKFTPRFAGARNGAVTLNNSSGAVIATAYLQGMGTGPQLAFTPGTQSVVASGSFSGSPINPYRVAVDGSGNVYYSDRNNNRVLKYTASSGTTSLVVGGLNTPYGVAVDGSGAVYVGDTYNNQVLKETPTTAGTYTQTTVAGGLSSPWGVAVDPLGNVYIADNGTAQILKETLTPSGVYTQSVVVAGLNSPYDVGTDAVGNVYHTDTSSPGQVYKETLTASGYTQSVVASGLNSPYDVTVDGAGNVFVAETGNNRIVEESPSGSAYTQSIVLSGLNSPTGIAVTGAGNVYVGDNGSSRVLKLDLADPPALAFASTPVGTTSSDSPRTVTLSNIGNTSLTFPAPASAGSHNPSVSTGFTYGNSSTCPQLGSTSSSVSLTAGASCTEILSFAPQTAGTLSGSAVSTDNALNIGGATQSIVLTGTATPAAPTVAVTSTSTTYGTASTTLTATISYGGVADTGAVTFVVDAGASVTASCTASSYTETCTAGYNTNALGGGSHVITATVAADANYTAASGTATLTVTQAAPTVTVSSAAFSYGTASTTLTAHVAYAGPAFPSGALTLIVDSGATVAATCTGTGSPRTCTASYGTAALLAGSHTITATQAADANYANASSTATLNVTQGAVTLTVVPVSIAYGTASTTLTVSVAYPGAVAPTGILRFTVGSGAPVTAACTGTSSPRTCTASYPTATVGGGSSTVAVAAAADANYTGASSSGTLTVTSITPAVTVSSVSTAYGAASATLTAMVAYTGSAAPSGPLSFSISGSTANVTATCTGTGSPLTCTASYTTATLTGGSHTITVAQSADANYTPATGTATLTVTPVAPVVTVSASSISYGATSATLTSAVAYSGAAAPSGGLTFTVDSGVPVPASCSGMSSPLGCTASYPTSTLGAGGHTITAGLPADPNYTAASGTGMLTISPAIPAITWPVPAPINFGTPLSATQLNATANVPGSFAYSPASGTVPQAGAQTLTAIFTPTDATDYTTASKSVTLTVYPPAAAPAFSPATGAYTSPQNLTITDATSGATLYYTTDGTAPTTASPRYTLPISVATTTTVRAFAIAPAYAPSPISTVAITIYTKPVCTLSVQGTQTASQVIAVTSCTDPQGQPLTKTLNWGDGSTTAVAGSRIAHTYASAGTYTVVLTATDTSGLSGTAQQQVTPNQLPVCTLGSVAGTSATSNAVGVTATCTDPQHQPMTAAIDWGDGKGSQPGTANGLNAYTYANPAISTQYTVTLTATDTSGLSGTATQSFILVPMVAARAGSSSPVTATVAPQPASVSPAQVSVTFLCTSVLVPGSTTPVLPSQYGISCSSPTLTLSPGTQVQASVTINSTAATTVTARGQHPRDVVALCVLPLPFFGFTLLTLGALPSGPARRRRSRFQAIGLLLLLCLALSSCGGYFAPPPVVATPVGSYAITITEVVLSSPAPTGFVQTSLIVPLTIGK